MNTKIVYKTFKYRIYPSNAQASVLNKNLGACRWLFNYFLEEKQKFYAANKDNLKKSLNYYDMTKAITTMKKDPKYKWLSESNSQSLFVSVQNLEKAYRSFFIKKTGFPNFKSKKDKQSFCVPQNFKIKNNKLFIPKCDGGIKIILHRPFVGRIIDITIIKTKCGHFFACLNIECQHEIEKYKEGKIGIDVGIRSLYTDSDGYKRKNPKTVLIYEKRIKYLNRKLSNKKAHSRDWFKIKNKMAVLYNKSKNIRYDNLHKSSFKIISENQTIITEDLSIKSMVKDSKYAKLVSDCGWGELFRQIKYKSNWNNREYIKIDRYFPSSKTCNRCGHILSQLPTSIRTWRCPNCSSILDRDINAAINILKEGLKNKNCGCGVHSQSKQKRSKAFAWRQVNDLRYSKE